MTIANIMGPDLLVVLALAAVLIFGANRLPKMAKNIGEASKEFKKAQAESAAEAEAEAKTVAAKPATPSDEDKITLSKADLDALLAEREARARREAADKPPAN
jgi:TatA/E family protein of Tat protein translocase